MKIFPLSIPEVLLMEPIVFADDRGFFYESFRVDTFKKITPGEVFFVQDNHSKSSKGVLRGLHYQIPPYAQDKLIRVINGKILDVAVDIRKSSPTFGKYVSKILSAENKLQMWVPKGFAHGFIALSDDTEVSYKITNFYNQKAERCILWNDFNLNIDWPKELNIKLSEKDQNGSLFFNAEYFP
jgi:dTDP-4-dehydrorhamnose 3,5-epimerase